MFKWYVLHKNDEIVWNGGHTFVIMYVLLFDCVLSVKNLCCNIDHLASLMVSHVD